MKLSSASAILLIIALGGLSGLLVYTISEENSLLIARIQAGASIALAVTTLGLFYGTIRMSLNGARTLDLETNSLHLKSEIYTRRIEKERIRKLKKILNIILKNKELIRNNEFLFGGIQTVIFLETSDKYHVLVDFGHPTISRSKELSCRHYAMIRKEDDFSKIMEITFRGEYKVEAQSIEFHSGPRIDSRDSEWDEYCKALRGALNILKGSDITARSGNRNYANKSVEYLRKTLDRDDWKIRGTIRMHTKYDKRMKEAARTGNITEVKRKINKITHINARDEIGESFIHATIWGLLYHRSTNGDEQDKLERINEIQDRMTIIKMIVDQKGDVNLKNNYGIRPIHYACIIREPIEILNLLLEVGADPNWKTGVRGDGNAPLHFAAKNGNVEAIKLLIENGANVNSVNKTDGKAPLHSICDMITRFRITDEEDTNNYNSRVSEAARLLIESGANVDKRCKNNADEKLPGYSFREFINETTIKGADLTKFKTLLPRSG